MTRTQYKVPEFPTDQTFPYVLVCSTVGTIISLGAALLLAAHSLAPIVA
jgi:hypothetical protein